MTVSRFITPYHAVSRYGAERTRNSITHAPPRPLSLASRTLAARTAETDPATAEQLDLELDALMHALGVDPLTIGQPGDS